MSSADTSSSNPAKYSREALIKLLRDFAEGHERAPTQTEMATADDMPSPTTFKRHFGSWNEAVVQAGLRPAARQGYSDDELITHLQAYAHELGRPPTRQEIVENANLPSIKTYGNHFGNFDAALEAAGLPQIMQGAEDGQLAVVDYILQNGIDGAPIDEIERECDVGRKTVIAGLTKVRKLNGSLDLPKPPVRCETCGDFADGVVHDGYSDEDVHLCESCAADLVFDDD